MLCVVCDMRELRGGVTVCEGVSKWSQEDGMCDL